MSARRQKVLLAMSGGVDSSVAAALLLERGYDVVGVFMRLGSPGESLDELIADATPAACAKPLKVGHQGCCSINDAADARLVAAGLGIPFYVVNFKKDFGRIMEYFAQEYTSGRTPNPCVRCNDWLKFGKLHDYARQIDADLVATGHYARVQPGPDGQPALMRGLDLDKDQSYVLFGVPRDRLGQMLLPIGAMRKPDVREHARRLGLPVFNKPDSQEICFIPDNDYAGFVERQRPDAATPGNIIDADGRVLGRHAGQHRFTIGQRRGIGVALGHPIFVIDRDPGANTVTVGQREHLLAQSCIAGEANWLVSDDQVPRDWTPCLAQFRSNADPVPASVRALATAPAEIPSDAPNYSGRDSWLEVRFDEPQEAVAPGQAIVIFDRTDRLVGGGWIARARRIG
ncbi:MAG: tRNA 2-thiouridine(34) synthase MnmA [Phycisphaerales bacterium]|jgi:tRNA-specific 2-thiouridylase|nr:tRNA 2-thiouridine(34) synthase MnmA [Phycisphaeraceae bacterium]